MAIDHTSYSISHSNPIALFSFVPLYSSKYRCHVFLPWTKKLGIQSDDTEGQQGYSLLFSGTDEIHAIPKEFQPLASWQWINLDTKDSKTEQYSNTLSWS